jgi:hypothetical protein
MPSRRRDEGHGHLVATHVDRLVGELFMATFGHASQGLPGSAQGHGQPSPRHAARHLTHGAASSVVGHTSDILLTLPDLRPAKAKPPVAPPINEELAPGWQVHRPHAADSSKLPDDPASLPADELVSLEQHENANARPQLWRYDEADTNQPPVSHEAWKMAMRRLVNKRKKIAAFEHRQLWYIGLATVAATVAALLGFSTMNEPKQFGLPSVPDTAPAYSPPIPITTAAPAEPMRTTTTPATPASAKVDKATPTLGQPNFAPRATQHLGDPKDVPPWESWPSQENFMTPPAASNSAASNDTSGLPNEPVSQLFPEQSPAEPRMAEGVGAAPLAASPLAASSLAASPLAVSTAVPTPLPPIDGQPTIAPPMDQPIQAKARLKGLIQKTTTRPAHDPVGPGLH